MAALHEPASESQASSADASQEASETTTSGELPRQHFQVQPSTGPIEIDGRLDDLAWKDALEIDLAWETDPADNAPADIETRCWLTFDAQNVYVAFRAEDPDPSGIRARLADRDTVFSDEFVGVIFDTFNDQRRGLQFFVNPLGVQIDALLDEVSGGEDESWDVIWSSAGRLTEFGYETEMAIPFSSLRFPDTDGEMTWGLDTLRWRSREVRRRFTSVPRDRNNTCHLCQLNKVTGFRGADPGKNLEIVPTITVDRLDSREDLLGPLENGSENGELGATVRWGINPDLTLSATVNPDFSQVEADVARLDVNQQFTLFFPERRPFFLEGADFFNTPIQSVFTRNVANPQWGAKVIGKQGDHFFGSFVARDEITNLILPGAEGSDSTTYEEASTAAVARYRLNLGDDTTLGLLVTSREATGYSNRVAGIDGVYRPTSSDILRVQYLQSRTEYPQELIDDEDLDVPANTLDGSALRATWNRNSRDWNVYATYERIDPEFRADMGFVPRVGYDFQLVGAQRKWWADGDRWWQNVRFGGDYDITEDSDGRELEREAELFLNLSAKRQSRVNLGLGTRDRSFEGTAFNDEWYHSVFFTIQPTGKLTTSLFYRSGDDIDFANVRPARSLIIEPTIRLDLGRRVRMLLEHDFRRLTVNGRELFTANLSQTRIVYQLNLRTFIRWIGQYSDIDRDPSLYEDEVEENSRRFLQQLLFSYKLNPRTVLFLGYSETSEGETPFREPTIDLTQVNRTFFMKIGYAWVL
ncbi:MAG: DUF5916 domain-containing protein [Acidobacteriota bacterium]